MNIAAALLGFLALRPMIDSKLKRPSELDVSPSHLPPQIQTTSSVP
jgi:hypothetical protein